MFGKESFPKTVCDGIFNLSINKSTCDFCQIFLLDKRCSTQFCVIYQIKSNVYLMYIYYILLFMFFFLIPSQSVLAKAFRKISIVYVSPKDLDLIEKKKCLSLQNKLVFIY